MQKHVKVMADYNQWMNEKLMLVCEDLDPTILTKDSGAFFKSILGTWNHIMVADLVWLSRFVGHPSNIIVLESLDKFIKPSNLNQILYSDWTFFKERRRQLDQCILSMAEKIRPEDLESILEYHSMSGDKFSNPLWLLLTHFFNHQTHHRGQLTDLIHQQGLNPGVTDLVAMVREQKLALHLG